MPIPISSDGDIVPLVTSPAGSDRHAPAAGCRARPCGTATSRSRHAAPRAGRAAQRRPGNPWRPGAQAQPSPASSAVRCSTGRCRTAGSTSPAAGCPGRPARRARRRRRAAPSHSSPASLGPRRSARRPARPCSRCGRPARARPAPRRSVNPNGPSCGSSTRSSAAGPCRASMASSVAAVVHDHRVRAVAAPASAVGIDAGRRSRPAAGGRRRTGRRSGRRSGTRARSSSSVYWAWPAPIRARSLDSIALRELERPRPAQLELAHVRHVEEPAAVRTARCSSITPSVRDRHLPAGEVHHPGSRRHVTVVERGSAKALRLHTGGAVYPLPMPASGYRISGRRRPPDPGSVGCPGVRENIRIWQRLPFTRAGRRAGRRSVCANRRQWPRSAWRPCPVRHWSG